MNATSSTKNTDRTATPAPRSDRDGPTTLRASELAGRRWFFSFDGWRMEEADEGYVLA